MCNVVFLYSKLHIIHYFDFFFKIKSLCLLLSIVSFFKTWFYHVYVISCLQGGRLSIFPGNIWVPPSKYFQKLGSPSAIGRICCTPSVNWQNLGPPPMNGEIWVPPQKPPPVMFSEWSLRKFLLNTCANCRNDSCNLRKTINIGAKIKKLTFDNLFFCYFSM